ncbi:MAG: hypothetical protein R3E31_25615 [Chloroflexota bacterium]|nr:hypothetical protein [Anaerolineales bacterium]MCA9976728.1 hypothetical protein [Anaerolineales bacterium]MCB8968663.1 hypothetical protein [Ardenticatenaceae bacterium]
MITHYHVNGTCEVEYPYSKKVEEFYVDDVVKAESEVQAVTAVAKLLIKEHDFQNFVWTRLNIESVPS